MKEFDPAGLITRIAAHQDRAAFTELFEFYAPRIKTFMMRRGVNAENAEELAQETLLRLWRKSAQFDPARATPAAWIFSIARNLRIDRLRQEKRAQDYSVLETEPAVGDPERPDDLLLAGEREDRVRRTMEILPDDQLRVVMLSFFEGRAHAEIASLLRIPLGTVKSRMRLALRRLRENIGEMK